MRNHQKLLRYCQRVKSAGVDRTESFYAVCKLTGEKTQDIINSHAKLYLVNGKIPVEVQLARKDYAVVLCYAVHVPALRQCFTVETLSLRSILVFSDDVPGMLQRLLLKPVDVQKYPE